MIELNDIKIRNNIIPGDLGYLIHLHGLLYGIEYGYGTEFEMYVAEGFSEFYKQYDPTKDRIWLGEYGNAIIGSLVLMHRKADAAQLRYFLIRPEYRGIGLGKRLMNLYMQFLHQVGYSSSYLWTTSDLATAASLYTRNGFILTEEKDSIAFGKPLKEQRYDLLLS